MKPSTPSQATTAMHTTDSIDTPVSCAPSEAFALSAASAGAGVPRGLARWWRPVRLGALAALAVFVSCNLNESGESSTPDTLVGFAPRILPAGEVLPEVDSVRLVLRLGTGGTARTIERTVVWGAREFVFDRVPVGSAYTILVEGRKVGMDGVTQSVWWRAEQSGTIAASNNAFSPILVVEELADMTVPQPVDPPAVDPPAVADTATKATVRFTAPADAESVYVAGQRVSFTPGQAVSVDVLFAAGETEKTVLVRIVDGNDNVWEQRIKYVRASTPSEKDLTKPEITLLAPSKDTSLDAGTTSLVVRVRATDSSGIESVTIDGLPASASGAEWSRTVDLAGTKTIAIVATDSAGNSGTASFTATVSAFSGNVRLAGLGLPEGYAQAPTGAADTVWQVTVPNADTAIDLVPAVQDDRSTILYRGQPLSGSLHISLLPAGGEYEREFVVVAPGGVDSQGYLVRIVHLAPAAITLTPVGGDSQTYRWRDSLPSIAWTVRKSRTLGRATIDGQEASCSQQAAETVCSAPVPLSVGGRSVVIEAAYDGVPGTSWTDTVWAIREEKPGVHDAGLFTIGASVGTIDTSRLRAESLIVLSIPNPATSLTLAPQASAPEATVIVLPGGAATREHALSAMGDTLVDTVVVTAQDGETIRRYFVRILHAAPQPIGFTPVDGRTRTVDWEDSLQSVTWRLAAERALGAVSIDGAPVTCVDGACTSPRFTLAVGQTTVRIAAAYAGIGSVWRDSVLLTRLPQPQSNDAGLENFGPGLVVVQNGNDSNWILPLADTARSVTIAPMTRNSAATFTINDTDVAQKTIVLRPDGDTLPIVVTVTSQDGKSRTNYRLRLQHPAMPAVRIVREGARSRSVTFGVTSASAAWAIPATVWPLGSVTIDGTIAQPLSDGRYVKTIPLPRPNAYRTILRARYEGGLAEWADTVTIVRLQDDSIPVVTRGLGASMRAVSFDTTATSASWSVMDNHKVVLVTINGNPVQPANGVYRINLTLTQPRMPVVLVARDSSGNEAKDSIEIVHSSDAAKPVVAPSCGASCDQTVPFASRTYLASWTVTDNNAVSTVEINGTTVAGQSGVYARTVNLVLGLNRIILIARDPSSNETRDTIEITRQPDQVAPTTTRSTGTQSKAVAWETRTFTASWTVTDNDAIDAVTINGTPVAATAGTYSTTANLSVGSNRFIIVARDATGNEGRDTVTITRSADVTAPTATPSTATVDKTVPFGTTTFTPAWTVTDNDEVSSVTINGILTAGQSDIYSRVVNLAIGLNRMILVANDPSGNTKRDTVAIIRQADVELPTVTRTTGTTSKAVAWETTGFTASWTVSDNDAVQSVTINGQLVAPAAGAYSQTANLVVGLNRFVIVARDVTGNERKDSVDITRAADGQAPSVIRSGTTVNQTVPFLTQTFSPSWTVTDNDAISLVTINGNVVTGSAAAYARPIDLVVGDNLIRLVARDPSGNETRDSVTITRQRDIQAPAAVRTGETYSRTLPFGTTTHTVGWTVTDDHRVASVTIGGIAVTATSGSLYSRTIDLATGANSVLIVARDSTGNERRDSVVITRESDIQAPTLTVVTTTRTVAKATDLLTIQCRASDNDQVSSVTINGLAASHSSGVYQSSVGLAYGSNTVTIVAKDPSGNTTSQQIVILRDNVAPTVSSKNSPAGGVLPWSSGGTYNAQWVLADNYKMGTVTIDGAAANFASPGTFSRAVAYSAGRTVIRLVAQDSVGNETRDSMVFETKLFDRDNNAYKIRLMPDGKVWMAQNLQTMPSDPTGWSGGCGGPEGDVEDSCAIYGRRYEWHQAMDLASSFRSTYANTWIRSPHQGLCPERWHVPTSSEWSSLFTAVASEQGVVPPTVDAGAHALKSATGWWVYGGGFTYFNGANRYGNFLVSNSYSSGQGGAIRWSQLWLPKDDPSSGSFAYVVDVQEQTILEDRTGKGSPYVGMRCVANP